MDTYMQSRVYNEIVVAADYKNEWMKMCTS